MDFAQMNLIAALPEIFLLSLLGVVLLVDLFLKDEQRYITHFLTQLGLLAAVGLQDMLTRTPLLTAKKPLAECLSMTALHNLPKW